MADQTPSKHDYVGDWWENLPAVDDWEPRLTREPDTEPDEDGLRQLSDLQERLEERAQEPDVQAFIERAQHE